MTNTDWHTSEGILTQFADDPAGVDEVRAASLEAHLITCSHCRNQLSQLVGGSFIDDSWARVADQIDRVRPSPWEWAMQCVGVPESWARLLSATPGLQASWVAGLLAVLIAIVAGARVAESAGVFLVAAPLVPMIVEAVAFVPTSDPAGEAGVATPMHGLALALRRTLVVSTAAFVVLAVAQVAVGAIGVPVMAWVLPAMALAAGVLALGTWFRIEVAVGVLAGLWVMVVTSVRWIDDAHAALADSVTFAAPGRWAALVLLLAAVAVIARHQDRFETLEVFR